MYIIMNLHIWEPSICFPFNKAPLYLKKNMAAAPDYLMRRPLLLNL